MNKNKILGNATCCICAELESGQLAEVSQEKYHTRKRLCLTTNDFVVVPSLSPLVVGHMLVFPTKHLSSLCQLASFDSFQAVAEAIVRKIQRAGHSIFFFEHGVPMGMGACGIAHAHCHILPLPDHLIPGISKRVASEFPATESGSLKRFARRCDRNMSYLMHGIDLQALYFSPALEIPSQYMRRVLASALGLDEWNWKTLNGRDRFLNTLQLFHSDRRLAA